MKPLKRRITSQPIVIYPIKHKKGSKWDNNELRFSLRSLDKNFRLDNGERPKVFVISTAHLPFLNKEKVTVVPVKGYAEAVVKAWELARKHSPTNDYVWMNDDIGFMRPTTPSDLIPAIHTGEMMVGKGEKRGDVGGWRWKLVQLRDRLGEIGINKPCNFSTHSPYLFNAYRMELVAGIFGLVYKTPLETAYFNFWRDEIPTRIGKNDRFVRHHKFESLPFNMRQRFYNYADGELNNLMRGFFHGMFPTPSIYEIK